MCTSRHRPDSRRAPVLFAEPDIELTRHDWLPRLALSVTDLILADSLPPELCLEYVANERRSGSLSSPSQLVDELQEAFVDCHLDRLHGCGFQCVLRPT